jgi:hypothetical protein
MSSIFGYIFYFLTLCIIIIDTRSINQKDNSNDAITLANYRHQFEHSMKFKKIRWEFESRYNKAYCQFCNLVVPVVRFFD